jgi:hypothetical protein
MGRGDAGAGALSPKMKMTLVKRFKSGHLLYEWSFKEEGHGCGS